MKRIDWPVWLLCVLGGGIGVLAFTLGVWWRSVMPDETSQSKALATQALAVAFDLLGNSPLRVPAPVATKSPVVQSFVVPRPFSTAGDAVGFTIHPLESPTYLVRSDDQRILLLLQPSIDGRGRQCLIHPPHIQVSSCQLGSKSTK